MNLWTKRDGESPGDPFAASLPAAPPSARSSRRGYHARMFSGSETFLESIAKLEVDKYTLLPPVRRPCRASDLAADLSRVSRARPPAGRSASAVAAFHPGASALPAARPAPHPARCGACHGQSPHPLCLTLFLLIVSADSQRISCCRCAHGQRSMPTRWCSWTASRARAC